MKTLLLYQSWSEDFRMPYSEKAQDMYNLVEGVIVNSDMPGKYEMKLVKKVDVEREADENSYS